MYKLKTLNILFVLFIVIFNHTSAQNPEYLSYNWDISFEIPENDNKAEGKRVLWKNEFVEFIYQDDYFYEFNLFHTIEFIGTAEEAELNFKKFIFFSQNSEVVEAKAKVIKPDGEEFLLNKSNILESKDEETGANLKYFALQGLSKGDVINFYYVLKKYPNYNGAQKIIQEHYPINNYSFKLFAPQNLRFKFKVMNDTAIVIQDTTCKDKSCWEIVLNNIDGLEEEQLAPYNLLLKKVIYKLDENTSNNKKDITNYGLASQNIYQHIYFSLEQNDLKTIEKIIKEISIPDNAGLEDKILLIENYIKTNINFLPYNDPNYDKPTSIYKNKLATTKGVITLFANILRNIDINHQLVLTCDRTKSLFDKEFESFHFLEKYLIYFPETDKYLIPDNIAFRYGLIPNIYSDNYGLFIEKIKFNEFETGLGQVKYIDGSKYLDNHMNHSVIATINKDFSEVDLDITKSFLGHYSIFIQPYMQSLSEDIVEETAKELLRHYTSDFEKIEWSFENTDPKYTSIKPMIFHGKVTNKNFIEVAGNNFLLKVGELIEPQVEMYSDKERKLPIYDQYKREFNRKIIINIPKGFRAKNLEDINVAAKYSKDGKDILLFKSTYKIQGEKIEINIKEYYDQIFHEVKEFESYRKVVNCASDFNKVILVFVKN